MQSSTVHTKFDNSQAKGSKYFEWETFFEKIDHGL